MASSPLSYLKILVVVLVLGGALLTHLYIRSLKSDLEVCNLEREKALLIIKDLTEETSAAKARAKEAEEQRAQIRQDLSTSLERLRAQKPPKKCEDAIKWAVERKGDLKW